MSTVALLGRAQELSHIGQLIDGVHDGGSALLVRGEAGIGKSAVVAAAARRAKERGFRVLTTTVIADIEIVTAVTAKNQFVEATNGVTYAYRQLGAAPAATPPWCYCSTSAATSTTGIRC